jgi:DNA polymerase I-like protein with 3'-5' exonuclease and polymerase domains
VKTQTTNPNHAWLKHPTQRLAIYNCHDTVNTARILPHLIDHLQRNGQFDFYRRWFDETVPVVMAMMKRGIGQLDIEGRNLYRTLLKRQIRDLEEKILARVSLFDRLTDELESTLSAYVAAHPTAEKMPDIKRRSGERKILRRRASFFNRGGERENTDLAQFLYDELGFKIPPKTTKRKARSVGQDALFWILEHLRVKDEPHRWILEDLFHRSRLNTIRTRYLTVDCEPDGRVHPTIKLYAAETLRISYSGDRGEAIHQWPKEARWIIGARPGHTFISRDYSQIEARVMAVLANDRTTLDAFAAGVDVHVANSLDLFSLTTEDWDALPSVRRKETRNYSKGFLYKISYGGKGDTDSQKLFCPCPRCIDKVPQSLDLSRVEKKAAEERWNRKHRATLVWRATLLQQIKGPHGDHSWTSPFGYRRFFLEPLSEAERSIYNFPMQHCAAEIVRRAMVRLHALGCPIVIQMHDELVAEVPDGEVDHWSEVMRVVMETPVPELGGTVFPTDVAVGKTWAEVSDQRTPPWLEGGL